MKLGILFISELGSWRCGCSDDVDEADSNKQIENRLR